jgi:NADH:ubiquinone oxidoreductase subunit 3 (subunit A)
MWVRILLGQMYYLQYYDIFIFAILSALLSGILFSVSYFLSPKAINAEKLSAYECGFEPFDEARKTFDIHFYVVAILFVIFDLEIAFLIPWSVFLNEIGLFGFWNMIIFLLILTVGFVYEWLRGALDWSVNLDD